MGALISFIFSQYISHPLSYLMTSRRWLANIKLIFLSKKSLLGFSPLHNRNANTTPKENIAKRCKSGYYGDATTGAADACKICSCPQPIERYKWVWVNHSGKKLCYNVWCYRCLVMKWLKCTCSQKDDICVKDIIWYVKGTQFRSPLHQHSEKKVHQVMK